MFNTKHAENIISRLTPELMFECQSETCVWNPEGYCMRGVVTGKAVEITDDGCTGWTYNEEEN